MVNTRGKEMHGMCLDYVNHTDNAEEFCRS